MADHAIAALHEAIADRIADRDAVIWRDRRLSWGEIHDRTHRLANALLGAGVGGDPPPLADLSPWESPHHHVALVLTNGNEYLESMLAAWKARAASVNCNYRYTASELRAVLGDAQPSAVVYHRRFSSVVSAALDAVGDQPLLVHVEDASEASVPAGSVEYEAFLAGGSPHRPDLDWSPDDHYIVFTGGTTGHPKGVLWRQGDFLATALGIDDDVAAVVDRAARPDRPRALPAPPFMHGAAHWNALSCWLAGGTVVIQDDTDRLNPMDVLSTCARHDVTSLLIVGDAFARPLLDTLSRGEVDPASLSSLRLLMTGGAVLSRSLREGLQRHLPDLRIVDILGSSETGRHGIGGKSPGFRRSDTTVVVSADRTHVLEPGDPSLGWLAQAGRVPRGFLNDSAKTQTTFTRIGGERYAISGDRARIGADGTIELAGRDAATINTGGEKVFAEEVEEALKDHPAIVDALAVGRPSPRWGSEIVAVVTVRGGSPDWDEVRTVSARRLARFKLPKDFVVVPEIVRSASGKPDYRWAREVVAEG